MCELGDDICYPDDHDADYITSVHTGYAGADSSFSWRSASQSPPRGSGSNTDFTKCCIIIVGVGARRIAEVSLQPLWTCSGPNLYKPVTESPTIPEIWATGSIAIVQSEPFSYQNLSIDRFCVGCIMFCVDEVDGVDVNWAQTQHIVPSR